MSDRVLVSPTEILFSKDVLQTNKFAHVGMGRLAGAILGETTQLNGFACVPTAPASLSVEVGQGEIYILEPTDPTAYGVLPVDNIEIVKQGISETTVTLNAPAATTPGNSINYLVQVGFLQSDGTAVLRQFYNSADPTSPTLNTVDTIRSDAAVVQIKAGVQAPTGTQVTPAPDAGFAGAWVVTVANGATTITSGNIVAYSSAPFITDKLKDKISQTQGDARYARLSQLESSVAANGYQKFPGGLIMQWGTVLVPFTGSDTQVSAPVTFPIAFPTAPFSINTTYAGVGSSATVGVATFVSPTASGFTAWVSGVDPFGTSGNFPVYWMAIGH